MPPRPPLARSAHSLRGLLSHRHGLRAVDLLEIMNDLQNRWLGTVEVQACIRLERVAPWRAEKNDDEIIGRMLPRAHQILVTAANKVDRRVEVRDILGRQVKDGRLDLKTDAPCTG